jgi:hypothetical protein
MLLSVVLVGLAVLFAKYRNVEYSEYVKDQTGKCTMEDYNYFSK